MKRTLIRLEDVARLDNLALAFHKAAKGKRYRPDVQIFSADFDVSVSQLGRDILLERLPYGGLREFYIHDPKKRLIHAACFHDRVFHHALMNLAGTSFERSMSPRSYACRPGKGVHRAVRHVQQGLRLYSHYVKIDISGYFPSISHRLLLRLLARRFKGNALLDQWQRIVESYSASPGRGLPIGSLTSQYFANYYLDGLDRFLENYPLVRTHVRYMDDIIWWCGSRAEVKATLAEVSIWLLQQRELSIKPTVQIQTSQQGVTYCGYRILPGAIRLTRRKKRRYQQRRKYWERLYLDNKISATQLQLAYASVEAITAGTDSLAWRRENLKRYPPIDV